MTRDCNHGQLARSCNICEIEQEIASLKAKLAEAEKDAARYQQVKSMARKSEASDRFAGYHWQIGLYDPKCVGFDSSIDAMIRGRVPANP